MPIIKQPGHPKFFVYLDYLASLHRRKNLNYANSKDPLSNFRASEEFGIAAWKAVLVRMSDKYSRLVQLAQGKPDLVGESFQDTLLDLASCSIICAILLDEKTFKGGEIVMEDEEKKEEVLEESEDKKVEETSEDTTEDVETPA